MADDQRLSPTGVKIETDEKGVSGKDPLSASVMLRRWKSYLDEFDPDAVTVGKLLKMRHDPAIALGLHMIYAPLIKASWDIVCQDPLKRAFLKAAIRDIYQELMLYSLSSIALGYAAITKQFWFRAPDPDEGGPQTWTQEDVKPVTIRKLRQVHPVGVKCLVESDEFRGIQQAGQDPIGVQYSLWVTHGKETVFGDLYGWALPRNVYHLWWSRNYRYALKDRHIEDRVSPPIVVRHPPGYVEDEAAGEKIWYRDAAIALGKAVRSGETIAMSSEQYTSEFGDKTGTYKWGVDYLLGGENADAFIRLDDQDDARTLMGLLIPPQSLLSAQGGLGSQAVAQTLGEMFWISQGIRKDAFDLQFNRHIVDQLSSLNFPADSPRARLVTTGFDKQDIALMDDILKGLFLRPDLPEVVQKLNVEAAMRERGLPIVAQGGASE